MYLVNKFIWITVIFLICIGNQGFKDCMTRNRFTMLSRYLHVNDNSTQGAPGSPQYDRYILSFSLCDSVERVNLACLKSFILVCRAFVWIPWPDNSERLTGQVYYTYYIFYTLIITVLQYHNIIWFVFLDCIRFDPS